MPDVRTPDRPVAAGSRPAGSQVPARPRGDASAMRVAAMLVAAIVVVVVAVSVLPGSLGPGLGVAAAGFGAALAFYALNRPVLAVAILLFCSFLRLALRNPALPAEPVFLALVLVLVAAAIAVTRRVNQAPQFGAVETAMALFLVWNIGSAIAPHMYSAGGDQTIGEVQSIYHFVLIGTLMPFVLYVVGRFVFDRAAAVRTLLWAVMGFAAYSVMVSILRFHAPALVWPRYILTDWGPDDSWSNRAVGVFSQPVANGLMLIAGFVLAVYLAHQADTRRWQRIVLGLLALTSLYAIYLTYTRAVWLGFAVAVVLAAVFLPRSRRVYVATFTAMVLGVLANASTFFSEDRSAGGVGSSYEIEDRLNMIATALWAIGERPVFGWGIGRFSQVNTYHHQQWSQEVDWIRGFGISSHEMELGLAAELGLVGLALYLIVIGLLVRGLWQAVRTLPPGGVVDRDLAVVTSILFAVWILTGFTADLRFFDFMAMLMLLLVGIVVGVAQRHAAAAQFRPPPASREPDDDLL